MCLSSPMHDVGDLTRKVEAILFSASEGASSEQIAAAVGSSVDDAVAAIEDLSRIYSCGRHGIEVVFLGGAWYLCTIPEVFESVNSFRENSERDRIRLSKAALETLAVIAYNQPVTRSEVEDIRGVRCERVIDTLLNHGLIRISGRRKATGSPLLYRTGDSFLKVFGLGSISDLPTVAEIEELRSAGETVENEA